MLRSVEATRDPGLIGVLLSLGLGYLRWLVLVPMFTVWTFYLLMVLALLLTNFQDSAAALFAALEPWLEPWLGPPPASDASAAAPDSAESIELNETLIMPVALKLWGLAALLLWGLGELWRLLRRRPAAAPRLGRKLVFALAAIALGWLLMLFAYGFGSETFHGSLWAWLAMFTGVAFLAALVTLACLGLSHVLAVLADRLTAGARHSGRDRS
ncbi:hypothetical protein [Wenzhouxiangella marina]|uniref:Uncharacterized protein n=1 Tax=Wenzhouxiangella marina TaxID=1579979 RepID=A0A0K0XXD6_9GAMM|nr:hypothetical protein [Wenzhouxiangella marina]AKS42292.1 hypothetical protein WM2015_1926 [Wenzhouxiangella marina]MBB6085935.1 hypothetical protein [Wenzhouxiangella marina]